MDWFLEFLVEVLFEGVVDAVGNPKIPKWIRMTLVSIVLLPIAGLLIYASVLAYANVGLVGVLICLLIAAGVLAGMVYLLYRIAK
ncbi:MAG: hypothetical protein LBM28_01125 [Oscillospiraceae bacterium]|jgi:hypothetical protein|nr:hypothetical protein [Oscillospiraceae bacterium]